MYVLQNSSCHMCNHTVAVTPCYNIFNVIQNIFLPVLYVYSIFCFNLHAMLTNL